MYVKGQDFVVYAYSRKDWTFYYIGKGKPQRPYSNHRNIKKPKDKSHIHILHEGLDEKTAFEYEIKLILMYGRKDLYPDWGILRNLTNGGEGATGFSKETIEKISGKNSPQYKERNWCHIEHGFEGGSSCAELAKKYEKDGLLESSLSNLATGKIGEHKGWVYISEEEIEKNKGKGNLNSIFNQKYAKNRIKVLEKLRKEKLRYCSRHHMYTKRDWCHVDRGFVRKKSNCDLIKEYPEDGLGTATLSAVALGRIHSHKGWILVILSKDEEKMSTTDLSKKYTPEYAKRKIKELRSTGLANITGPNNSKYKARNWCHIEIGFIGNKSAKEVANDYPEFKFSYNSLCSVATGKRKFHKGLVFLTDSLVQEVVSSGLLPENVFSTEYAKSEIERLEKEIKESNSGSNNHSYKIHNWYHKDYGYFYGKSSSDLIKMFPDLKLRSPKLSMVVTKKAKSHKGWILVE